MRSPDGSLTISALAGNNHAEVGSTMSDTSKKPAGEQPFSELPSTAVPPGARIVNGPEVKPDAQQGNHAGDAGQGEDPREALKRGLEENRLPPEVKAQILAELPPVEEMERLYRELLENGGLSSEEFFASLGLEVEPQP
jgi:hypothetical protein